MPSWAFKAHMAPWYSPSLLHSYHQSFSKYCSPHILNYSEFSEQESWRNSFRNNLNYNNNCVLLRIRRTALDNSDPHCSPVFRMVPSPPSQVFLILTLSSMCSARRETLLQSFAERRFQEG
jgi:hypothetical protein